MEKTTFQTADGLILTGIWHLPKTSVSKAVILAHGITVDKDEGGIFIKLANVLEENGFAVFRFDFRGNGESEGKSIDMTISGEVLDMNAAVEHVHKHQFTTIGLLGASFGGGIASLYAEKYQDKLQCLCLWNPCLNYNHTFIDPLTPWLMGQIERMKKDFQEKGWTTLGSRQFIIGEKLFEEMKQLHPEKALKTILLPTLIIHGDKDTYVPYEDSQEYVHNLDHGELHIIRNGKHGFHDNGIQEETAIKETLSFFKKYL
jgi:alpha-beta hydrolase superfamily lysophospholipase